MIKPLIAILLLVTSLLATKNEEKIVTKHEEKLFKFQETNDPALLYTEDSKSKNRNVLWQLHNLCAR